MRLMREVRCFPFGEPDCAGINSWAGSPGNLGLQTFWALRAVVEGPVDPWTGYVCNIAEMDRLIRDAVPRLQVRATTGSLDVAGAAARLCAAYGLVAEQCPRPVTLFRLEWHISPFTSLAVGHGENHVIRLMQSFEFSASHRLFRRELSDDENRRVFGKCSNLNGHGHNYVVEVTVSGEVDAGGTVIDLLRMQRIVKERVIDQFDHKNLNLDCEEFSALIPSIENIALVIWKRLHGAFEGSELRNVRVWETPKTYAEIAGGSGA